MKRIVIALLGAGLSVAAGAEEAIDLSSEQDRINYAVGHQIGGDLQRHGVPLKDQALLTGIRDALSGAAPQIEPEAMRRLLAGVTHKDGAHRHDAVTATAQGEIAKGRTFLAENAGKEGVKVLPSGLQYRVIKSGRGKGSPKEGDSVTIHYVGSTIDGRTFGRSGKGGKPHPEAYKIEQLVPGVQEALKMMSKGDRWRLFIPPELGFPRGKGPLEFRAIIFDVELVDFG